MNLKNKRIVVVGLARSGISAAKFLVNQGALVTIVDRDKALETASTVGDLIGLGVRIKLGNHVPTDFHEAQLVVLSPGVSHEIPPINAASKRGIPVIGEVELASSFIDKPIIGVTGTNGKTTTVKLIKKMLTNSSKRVFLGGNMGVPLTECLFKLKRIEVVIAEISSFQLDTVKKFRPTTSVLLNVANDHMDRYSSFNDYADIKLRIFSNQTSHDVAVFNAMEETTKRLVNSRKLKGHIRPFSDEPVKSGAQILDDSILIFDKETLVCRFDLTRSNLLGLHNRKNIAAASLAALAEGGNVAGIQSAIDSFDIISHRIETVRYFRGIRFVNDSKATNVHATVSAVKCFTTPIVLIVGGRSKNCDFKLLKPHLSDQIKVVIAMGEARNEIKLALSSRTKDDNVVVVETMEDAVKKAVERAQAGYTILLSPACASFDQFKNYESRGQRFKELVEGFV